MVSEWGSKWGSKRSERVCRISEGVCRISLDFRCLACSKCLRINDALVQVLPLEPFLKCFIIKELRRIKHVFYPLLSVEVSVNR